MCCGIEDVLVTYDKYYDDGSSLIASKAASLPLATAEAVEPANKSGHKEFFPGTATDASPTKQFVAASGLRLTVPQP